MCDPLHIELPGSIVWIGPYNQLEDSILELQYLKKYMSTHVRSSVYSIAR